jgi:hypothetical protein
MIVYLPLALFIVSLLVAYGSAGRRRQVATIGVLLAAAWSLALLVDTASAAWAIGPIVATALLPRPGKRVNSSFEGLTRRITTIAVALLVAILIASRLPAGENPLLLGAVPWFLGALGAAWFTSSIDQPERLQGQVLMVAAVAAVILAAVPAGPVTAGLAGAMALMPLAGERWRLPGRLRLPLSIGLLGVAAVAAVVGGVGTSIARIVLFDLSLNVSGAILLAIAVLLVAGAAVAPVGFEWAGLLGALAVSSSAPSLRWAALGALIAVATVLVKDGEYLAWIALGILGQGTGGGARAWTRPRGTRLASRDDPRDRAPGYRVSRHPGTWNDDPPEPGSGPMDRGARRPPLDGADADGLAHRPR